jgi:hypothetical protein
MTNHINSVPAGATATGEMFQPRYWQQYLCSAVPAHAIRRVAKQEVSVCHYSPKNPTGRSSKYRQKNHQKVELQRQEPTRRGKKLIF